MYIIGKDNKKVNYHKPKNHFDVFVHNVYRKSKT